MSFQGPVWKRHHSLPHFICSPIRFCPPWVSLKQSPDCTSLQVNISSLDPKRQKYFSSNITAVSSSSPYATWHMVSTWKTYIEWMKKSVSFHFMEEKYYNEKVKWIGQNLWLLLTEPDEIDEINRFHRWNPIYRFPFWCVPVCVSLSVTFSAPVQCISIRHICFTFHKLNKLGAEWPLLCNLSASFLLESIISIKVLPLSL